MTARKWRIFVRLVFLLLFVLVLVKGRPQLWLAIFLGGTVLALFAGRVYCGWACPIGTAMDGAGLIASRLGWRKRRTPAWLQHPAWRYLLLALAAAAIILSARSGGRVPILPILAALGLILSLFYEDRLWHRFLCPYSIVLGFAGRLGRRGMRVDAGSCVSCGRCAEVCPADAAMEDGGKYRIDPALCLQCRKCAEECAVNAIR